MIRYYKDPPWTLWKIYLSSDPNHGYSVYKGDYTTQFTKGRLGARRPPLDLFKMIVYFRNHGKSRLNHHLENSFFKIPTTLRKSKYLGSWNGTPFGGEIKRDANVAGHFEGFPFIHVGWCHKIWKDGWSSMKIRKVDWLIAKLVY